MSEAFLELTDRINSNHCLRGFSRLSLAEFRMESYQNRSPSILEQNEIVVVDLPQSTV